MILQTGDFNQWNTGFTPTGKDWCGAFVGNAPAGRYSLEFTVKTGPSMGVLGFKIGDGLPGDETLGEAVANELFCESIDCYNPDPCIVLVSDNEFDFSGGEMWFWARNLGRGPFAHGESLLITGVRVRSLQPA